MYDGPNLLTHLIMGPTEVQVGSNLEDPSGQFSLLPRLCASEATVHLIYCAKYVSLGLVGDLAQDCSLCFVGLSTSELAIPHSAGEVLGVHGWHLRNGLLLLPRPMIHLFRRISGPGA